MLLIVSVLLPNALDAQSFDKHKWENRVILLVTDKHSSNEYEKQIEEFIGEQEALEERKMLIYTVFPNQLYLNFPETGETEIIKEEENLFEQFKKYKSPVNVVLIGLDGQVKMNNSEFTELSEIVDLVDSMPMRKSEMQKTGNK